MFEIFIRYQYPPISFNDNEFIAVGHIKYNYNKDVILDKSKFLKNKVLHFDKSCWSNPSNLIYMMYFYTFSKKFPFNITKISHAFIPDKSFYLLAFPMGITKMHNSNDFVISYGEGDCHVKLLHMSFLEIKLYFD